MRELEERRHRLEAQIAALPTAPVDRSRDAVRAADPAAILRSLEGTLNGVMPVLSMMTSAREMLRADGAEASRRGDVAGEAEATRLLGDVTTILDELAGSIAQLHAASDRMRATIESGGAGNMNTNDAG